MKFILFNCYEFNFDFTFRKVKRLTLQIPTKADDVHIEFNKELNKYYLCYWLHAIQGEVYSVKLNLPKTVYDYSRVSITPRTEIVDGKKIETNKQRFYIVDFYYK